MSDGSAAIENNLEALRRILVVLLSMVSVVDARSTLPRKLYYAVLRLLRPAEAAARRLIIASSSGMVVSVQSTSKAPGGSSSFGASRGVRFRLGEAATSHTQPQTPRFRLLDPPLRPVRIHRKYVPERLMPRIRFFDGDDPRVPMLRNAAPAVAPALPSAPSATIDASRLMRRLSALAQALDNIPAQARRFARWKLRHERARRQGATRRLGPLRIGRLPGGRLHRYDPSSTRRPRGMRDVDEVLAHAHALAMFALERRDTS